MISYTVGKLAQSSTHFTRGLVKYVPGRGFVRAVPFQKKDKLAISPFVEGLIMYIYFLSATQLCLPTQIAHTDPTLFSRNNSHP